MQRQENYQREKAKGVSFRECQEPEEPQQGGHLCDNLRSPQKRARVQDQLPGN